MALPKTLSEWQRHVQDFSVDIGSISNNTFPSGSRFSRKDYYALRVFSANTLPSKDLRSDHDCLPPDSVKRTMDKLEANEHLKPGFALLNRKIKEWTAKDLLKAGSLGLGLAQLQLIVDRNYIDPQPNDLEREGVSSRKILKSPRAPPVTRSMTAGQSIPIRSIPAVPVTPTPAPRKLASAPITAPATDPYSIGERIPSSLEPPLAFSTPTTAPLTGSSVVSTPSDGSMYVDDLERAMFVTGDEQTVNACLVNLLLPITWACGHSRSVHFDRQPFYLGPKANPLYQARVDGLLMIENDIKGFMEVKPTMRGDDGTVQIQESAEMAAFMYNQGPKVTSQKRKKWMISMGAWEGYITIASYNQAYVDFLYGANTVPVAESFMKMQEYGPFNLKVKDELKTFICNIMVLLGNDKL